VIEPAVLAIQTKASMTIEWKVVRQGARRVTGLEFRFRPDPQGRLDIDTMLPPPNADADAGVDAEDENGEPELPLSLPS
jgi:hypothetical protein